MTALRRLLAKEFLEIRRTWRLWTVLGVVLFFAVMSPLAAKATPALISSLTESQPGVVIKLPDPTYLDSYAQWIKNLSQIGLLVVVFASAGLLANERTAGTAVLVLSKPVSRPAFVVAKYVAQAVLVAGATVVGALVTLAGTYLVFGEAPVERLATSTGAWLAGALLAIAFVEVLSAVLPTLAAGIVGLVVWGMAGILGLWEPAVRYTPVGLLSAPTTLLSGKTTELAWPLVSCVVGIALAVALAGLLFSRREF